MIAVIQRVSNAVVSVGGKTAGSGGKGLCVLLGVSEEDTQKDAEVLANKVINLRIFSDENDRMNLSLKDIDGDMLLVSNFTLLASYRKGNRPDYMKAAAPQMAKELYEYFGELCQREIKRVEYGVFGAHMELSITNDGPVTIVMDSKVLLASKKSS